MVNMHVETHTCNFDIPIIFNSSMPSCQYPKHAKAAVTSITKTAPATITQGKYHDNTEIK